MADSKISELDLYNTISGNEEIAFAKGGANGKLTMQTVLNEARKDKVESEGYDSVVGDLESNLLTDALRKTPQVLSESEKQTARANIGAQGALTTSADLALSGDDVLSLTDMAKKRLFIDLWNECAVDFGRYNEETGYFELNGITDLTYDDAVFIYTASAYNSYPDYKNTGFAYNIIKPPYRPLKGRFRTNLPCYLGRDEFYGFQTLKTVSTYLCDEMEVLNLYARMPFSRPPYYNVVNKVQTRMFDFYYGRKLRKVIGNIQISYSQEINYGYDLPCLEEVNVYNITRNFKYFYKTPKLNYTSVKTMIEQRGGTNAITIWYHANVYNKILGTADDAAYASSGGTKEEWMALADLAASKYITLATE